jgi:hypothetical protein
MSYISGTMQSLCLLLILEFDLEATPLFTADQNRSLVKRSVTRKLVACSRSLLRRVLPHGSVLGSSDLIIVSCIDIQL